MLVLPRMIAPSARSLGDQRPLVVIDVADLVGRPKRGLRTSDLVLLLDGHRHAVQRAKRFASGTRLVGLPGLCAGFVEQRNDHRVQGGIDVLDVANMDVDDLFGGKGAGLDRVCHFRRAHMDRVVWGLGIFPSHSRALLCFG